MILNLLTVAVSVAAMVLAVQTRGYRIRAEAAAERAQKARDSLREVRNADDHG